MVNWKVSCVRFLLSRDKNKGQTKLSNSADHENQLYFVVESDTMNDCTGWGLLIEMKQWGRAGNVRSCVMLGPCCIHIAWKSWGFILFYLFFSWKKKVSFWKGAVKTRLLHSLLLGEVCNCFQLLRDLTQGKSCHVFIDDLPSTAALQIWCQWSTRPPWHLPTPPKTKPSFLLSSSWRVQIRYLFNAGRYKSHTLGLRPTLLHYPLRERRRRHTVKLQPPTTKKCWRRSEHLLWCAAFMCPRRLSEPKAGAQLLGSGSAASGGLRDVFKTLSVRDEPPLTVLSPPQSAFSVITTPCLKSAHVRGPSLLLRWCRCS